MKKLYAAAVCAVVLGVSSVAFAMTDQEFDQTRTVADKFLSEVPATGYHISAEELKKRIDSGSKDFVVVDVREKEEKYQAGHIPGAIYINFKDIAKKESLAKLPLDKDVILYCNTGHEENKALSVLRMLGYNAFAVKFGYVSWQNAKPTEAMQAAIAQANEKQYPVEK